MAAGTVIGLAVAAGVVGWPSAAGAASTSGVLRIHAAGSVYAGSNALIAQPTAPGAVATYTIEVVNRGSSLAQFNIQLANPDGMTVTLASGSVFTTPLADSPDGYFTKVLAPGKAEVLTLRATTPASAAKHDEFFGIVQLNSTDYQPLDAVEWISTVKATAGAAANDIVTATAGSAAVVAEPGSAASTIMTAEPIKSTATAIYSVKLQNDGPVAAQIHATLSRAGACPTPYQLTAKVGSVNVTSLLLAGTFTTPLLAHGKSTALTISIRSGNPAAGCMLEEDDVLADSGTNGQTVAGLITNLAAVLP
ncbi:MAG: hypothetical protein QOG80_1093 [Pseudonocardiales bacterium]|jgi:hypothetical protein|nr:hypothetical protein [Pseudonocardiales bacterium]